VGPRCHTDPSLKISPRFFGDRHGDVHKMNAAVTVTARPDRVTAAVDSEAAGPLAGPIFFKLVNDHPMHSVI
jgi:hypothetical protein